MKRGWKTALRLGLVLLLAAPGAVLGMKMTRNVPYARVPGVPLNLTSLDIYAPDDAGPAKRCPVMIYIHGGAWARGDKSKVGYKPAAFTARGYVFVSANYRLTTATIKFPVHAYDVARAVGWVRRNGVRYGANPERLFLMGHSAGCHLVAVVSDDPVYLKAQGLGLRVVKGVIDLDTAVYDLPRLAARNGGTLPSPYLETFGSDPADWVRASPISHVRGGRGIAPQLVVYSGSPVNALIGVGFRKEQADAYARALRRAGVKNRILPAPRKTHAEVNREFGKPGDPVSAACFAFLAGILRDLERPT
ncbi:MAG: alpha/beta hydrolase [Candidatus Aminicenantes bacterium]|nr:alpha/beta hydrolase [Candidatus Aminicenantes bacterium]